MNIQLITPFDMQWIEGYRKVFNDCDFEVWATPTDSIVVPGSVRLFAWLNEDTVNEVNSVSSSQNTNIVFIRRYELFTSLVEKTNWKNVDAVIMVNDELAYLFKEATGITPHVVHNGVITDRWEFRNRRPGNKIAVVGFINKKKNLPFAIQVMAALPKDYELHIAGGVQDIETLIYLENIINDLGINVEFHGHIEDMDKWLDDKNYLLSCALSEGSPNNVLEAMAKGIKPVIHNWPGAKKQFDSDLVEGSGLVVNTVVEAVTSIMSSLYESERYRQHIEKNHGFGQFKIVRSIIHGLLEKK